MENLSIQPNRELVSDRDRAATGRRKVYEAPAIVYESPLEVRAGSNLQGIVDPLDLFGTSGK